jgi:hypothetical protein
LHYAPEVVRAKTAAIAQTVLRDSLRIRSANFTLAHDQDLALLFDQYDARFFDNQLRRLVHQVAGGKIAFRFSPRMHSAGGKTTRKRWRETGKIEFEIAIAARLLFLTFGDAHRSITICGTTVPDRLTALLRIFEHELIHLLEMLVYNQSECKAPRFQHLAGNIFNHQGVTHDLITPRETAAVKHDLHLGDRVRFVFEGKPFTGILNRVTRRATVLVEDAGGTPYSNGKRYLKFYVPLAGLTKLPG